MVPHYDTRPAWRLLLKGAARCLKAIADDDELLKRLIRQERALLHLALSIAEIDEQVEGRRRRQ